MDGEMGRVGGVLPQRTPISPIFNHELEQFNTVIFEEISRHILSLESALLNDSMYSVW
jgi:hypothetical protein